MVLKYEGVANVMYYVGRIVMSFSVLYALPISLGLAYNDLNSVMDFTITASISVLIGVWMTLWGDFNRSHEESVSWRHGLIVASLTWLLLTFLCAIPYRLSGFALSYLDAVFDVMSGFTTTGVFLLQDLDHIPQALNLWRHLLTFVGGQGMIVLAISFFTKEIGSAYKFYVGEGKDVTLVPNVKGTARWIWRISLIYMLIGTCLLWFHGMRIGLNPVNAFLHGLYIFASAWSTGGFAPNYQNILFYHDFAYETLGTVFFILGSFNFGLHYAFAQGKFREFRKNLEIVSFITTSFLLSAVAVVYLSRTGIYDTALALFRRVVYNVLSAHTTTGFGSVYAQQFAMDWGASGITVLVIAMLIGGSACSTAGGIKGLRVGIVFKGIMADIGKLIKGDKTMRIIKYHHIKDQILDDGVFRSSAVKMMLYIVTFAIGVLATTLYGYSMSEAAFEVASVTGNVGLSIGIINASMPTVLKLIYLVIMFLGRLEFISIFVLIGMFVKGVRRWFHNY